MKIGFIGNFEPPHSTENERKWSFLKLGHDVVCFQENKIGIAGIIYKTIKEQKIDILLYSHTHGWKIQGLKSLFSVLKEDNIPTISVHLDRWAWLDREKDIGEEATWFTEHLFMADCSPEAIKLYDKFDLNYHYLRPGVVERDCYISAPDPVRFPHEIIFVGSKGYHKEYTFRPELVEWLHKTYGDKFGHYGDDLPPVRGHDLNVLYATAKIVVGDSCFGGRPNYVSDRYYETRGRGGFLLHPHVPGVDYEGVGHYDSPNLASLKSVIDFYLANDEKREKMRQLGFEQVKNFETYTHRAKEIIRVVNENK